MGKQSKHGWIIFATFIVLPFLIIGLANNLDQEIIGRLIATAILMLIFPALLFLYVFNPKIKIIKEGYKIDRKYGAKTKKKIELLFKGAAFFFMLFFVISSTVPFTLDVIDVCKSNQNIVETSGEITYTRSPLFGLWFLSQTIRLDNSKKANDNMTLLYSFHGLKENMAYTFEVLPRSGFILKAKQ